LEQVITKIGSFSSVNQKVHVRFKAGFQQVADKSVTGGLGLVRFNVPLDTW